EQATQWIRVIKFNDLSLVNFRRPAVSRQFIEWDRADVVQPQRISGSLLYRRRDLGFEVKAAEFFPKASRCVSVIGNLKDPTIEEDAYASIQESEAGQKKSGQNCCAENRNSPGERGDIRQSRDNRGIKYQNEYDRQQTC